MSDRPVPLRLTRDEIMRREVVVVDPDQANLTGNDINFTLPTGPGLIDLQRSYFQVEMTVTTAAGAAYKSTYGQNIALAEDAAQNLFSSVRATIHGTPVMDEDNGQGHLAGTYRRFLNRPAGHFDSCLSLVAGVGTMSNTDASVNPGKVPGAIGDLGCLADYHAAPGARFGETFAPAGRGFYAADGSAIPGSGGPNCASSMIPNYAARRMGVMDAVDATPCVLLFKPETALFDARTLLPSTMQMQITLRKNSNLATQFVQTERGFAAPTIAFKRVRLLLAKVIPQASAMAKIERPLRFGGWRHVINVEDTLPPTVTEGSYNLQRIVSGERPALVILAALSSAAVDGYSTASNHSAQYLNLTAAGPFAGMMTLGGGVTEDDSPYAAFTEANVTWSGDSALHSPIQQTVAGMEAVPRMYEMYKAACSKFSTEASPGLSYAQFQARPFICFDLEKDLPDDAFTGSLSAKVSLGRHTAPGADFGIKLVVMSLYRSTTTIKDGRVETVN